MQYCFYGVLSRLIGFYSVSDIIFCFHKDLLIYLFILQYLIDLIDFNFLYRH